MFFKKKVTNTALELKLDVCLAKIKLMETDIDSLRGLVNKKLGGRKINKKDLEEEETETNKKEFTLLKPNGDIIIS